MRLTNDEAILAAFNGTDSTARDLAGRLEEALEKVDELKLALKQIEMAPDFAAVNGVLETLEY